MHGANTATHGPVNEFSGVVGGPNRNSLHDKVIHHQLAIGFTFLTPLFYCCCLPQEYGLLEASQRAKFLVFIQYFGEPRIPVRHTLTFV
jgi:hypothetical protein